MDHEARAAYRRAVVESLEDHLANGSADEAAQFALALYVFDVQDARRCERERHPVMVGRYPRGWSRERMTTEYEQARAEHPNLMFVPADVPELTIRPAESRAA